MKTLQAVAHDVRANYPALKSIALISFVFLSILVVAHWGGNIPLGDMTRDPAAVKEFPFYVGFLSYIGVLLCCAAAAICFFSAFLLGVSPASSELRSFLLHSGLLSLLLTLDDLFMLHDAVFPDYLGVPDLAVYAAYGLCGIAYLVRFRHSILANHDYPLLGCALFFMSTSVVLDAVQLPVNPFLFEDGSKFIGFVSWLAYFSHASREALRGLA